MTATPDKPRPGPGTVRWLIRQVEHGLAVIGLGTMIYFACFNVSQVTSNSMAPTLQGESWNSGDLVLTERVTFWFRSPRRWEIITFRNLDGNQVMKRVIGLPGEHVQMRRDGTILIDDREVRRPPSLESLTYFPFGNLMDGDPVYCDSGYYVLGDDSKDSDDSRFNGPVAPVRLIGRAWLILSPASRRGFVNR